MFFNFAVLFLNQLLADFKVVGISHCFLLDSAEISLGVASLWKHFGASRSVQPWCYVALYSVPFIKRLLSLKEVVPAHHGPSRHPSLCLWIVLAYFKENLGRTHHYHHLCVTLPPPAAGTVRELSLQLEEHIEISEPRTLGQCRQNKESTRIDHIHLVPLDEVDVLNFLAGFHYN